jgi:hypothetical protein
VGLAAVTVSGCAGEVEAPAPAPPDPQVVLLRELIAEKERIIALYGAAAAGNDDLLPFRERHRAHLAELRRRLPPRATPGPATATPSGTPTPTPERVSLARLRDIEHAAAAGRPKQVQSVSPALAQLLASIGACEAAHAAALSRSL